MDVQLKEWLHNYTLEQSPYINHLIIKSKERRTGQKSKCHWTLNLKLRLTDDAKSKINFSTGRHSVIVIVSAGFKSGFDVCLVKLQV